MRRTGINPVGDLLTFISILGLIFKVRPDALLSYTVKPVVYGTLAATLSRVPKRFSLITGLGYAFGDARSLLGRLVQKIAQGLYKVSLLGATKVFFQNPDDQQLFRHLGLLKANSKSAVVNGSGVCLVNFAECEPPKDLQFLLIARLLAAKGVREYVEAARKIKRKAPATRFVLVGWIDDNPDAISQEELDTWISDGTIEFLGKLSDVREALSKCSVFVLPSYREGVPRTVLEAMAIGRAIITTDTPGCRETVIESHNGFLVPSKSVDELYFAMLRFVENPVLVYEMGKNSRHFAEEKFDVEKVNRAMLIEMGLGQDAH